MAKPKIITVPSPILKQVSNPVELNQATKRLIAEMKNILTKTEGIKGVGLAAVQIGVLKNIFLAYSEKSKNILTFINPEIVWYSKIMTKGLPKKNNRFEGCLSIPNVWAIVSRPKAIKIRYQHESGRQLVRKYSGMTAAIIQHEYDHTKGILFIEKALSQGQKLYTIKTDSEGKTNFEEIKL